ncbi:MAG: hypothetical protein EHM20_14930, partial [Alphaproteobacteria bacterium]
ASLRTRYQMQENLPIQIVSEYADLSYELINVEGFNEHELKQMVKEAYKKPFDLKTGPVFRIHLFRQSDDNFVLLLVMHHIVSDAWSLMIILREFKELYRAKTEGRAPLLPALNRNYFDFIVEQQQMLSGDRGKLLKNFWMEHLTQNLPILELPSDRRRQKLMTFAGASHYFRINKSITHDLREFSKKEGSTLFVTTLALFQVLLHRYTGQDDIIVGTSTAGRNNKEYNEVVGYFVNPVVIKGKFNKKTNFKNILEQTRQNVIKAIQYSDYPFPLLVRDLVPVRNPSYSPVFQVMFSYLQHQGKDNINNLLIPGNQQGNADWGFLKLGGYDLTQQEGQFEITLNFVETGEELYGTIKYNTDLFDAGRIERMADHYMELLKGILSNQNKIVLGLPILSEKEQTEILTDWNKVIKPFNTMRYLHQIYHDNAAKFKNSIAIVFENTKISYAQLEQSANQLAHYLRNLNVGPEVVVATCLDTSPASIIGMLGIMKSGGAFLPLDPTTPEDRLAFMLSDSNAKVLLTQKSFVSKFSKTDITILDMDPGWEIFRTMPVFPPEDISQSNNLL